MTTYSTTMTFRTALLVGMIAMIASGFTPATIPVTQRLARVDSPMATFMHRGRNQPDASINSLGWGFFGQPQNRSSERRNVHKGPSADHDPPREKDSDSRENEKSSSSILSKRQGYQRAEDWDAQQKAAAQELTWEQRVQFDGQRHGNGFKQNQILQQQLGKF